MRDIKFRGKRIDNGEWVYGYYLVEAIDDEGHFDHLPFIKEVYGDHYCDYEVDPKTVGQFTGLHDKKGKDIYEGDIVKDGWNKGNIGQVDFSGGSFNLHMGCCDIMESQAEDCEIIGNKFESSENIIYESVQSYRKNYLGLNQTK